MENKCCYECELSAIRNVTDAIYKSGLGNDCSKIVKLQFLQFYEDYLLEYKKTFDRNTILLTYICEQYLPDFKTNSKIDERINAIKECIKEEKFLLNERIKRLNNEIKNHAPKYITNKEDELITKSYLNITLFDYYLKRFRKPAPEDKLLNAIFGE